MHRLKTQTLLGIERVIGWDQSTGAVAVIVHDPRCGKHGGYSLDLLYEDDLHPADPNVSVREVLESTPIKNVIAHNTLLKR